MEACAHKSVHGGAALLLQCMDKGGGGPAGPGGKPAQHLGSHGLMTDAVRRQA